MSLRERIDQDLKRAMLDKNEMARDALRLVKSELLLEEVKLGRPIEDAEVITALQRAVKQRKDAIEQFKSGGRNDLVEAEEKQLSVITGYLPQSMSEADTRAAIEALKAELGLTTKKDLGTLMKAIKAKHPTADPKLASQIAGSLLS
ncbi:MAG: GatB/YqeY domain-containing protein [Deltaproteobacteria bacterium]|nr:GatB/YqeY domain-containing protein [Deltaproteobacteria bacterium]